MSEDLKPAEFSEAVAQAALAAAGGQGKCVATTVTEHCVMGTVVPSETFMGAELLPYTPPVEAEARPRHYLTRRLGRFRIGSDVIQFFPEQAQQVLMNCVVVRAEQRFDLDAIEYIAMCAQFRERNPGEDAPEYHALMRRDGDTVTFDRFIEHGKDQETDVSPAP